MIISLSFLTLTLHSVLIGKQGNGIANISVCSAGFTVVRNDQLLTGWKDLEMLIAEIY